MSVGAKSIKRAANKNAEIKTVEAEVKPVAEAKSTKAKVKTTAKKASASTIVVPSTEVKPVKKAPEKKQTAPKKTVTSNEPKAYYVGDALPIHLL